MPLFRTSRARHTCTALFLWFLVPLPRVYASAYQRTGQHFVQAVAQQARSFFPSVRAALKRPTPFLRLHPWDTKTKSKPLPAKPLLTNLHVCLGVAAGVSLAGGYLFFQHNADTLSSQGLEKIINSETTSFAKKSSALLKALARSAQAIPPAGAAAVYEIRLRLSAYQGALRKQTQLFDEESLTASLGLIKQALEHRSRQGLDLDFSTQTEAVATGANSYENWLSIKLQIASSQAGTFLWQDVQRQLTQDLMAIQYDLGQGWQDTDTATTPPMQYYLEEGKKYLADLMRPQQSEKALVEEGGKATSTEEGEVLLTRSMKDFRSKPRLDLFFVQLRRCKKNLFYGLQSRPQPPYPYTRIEVAGTPTELAGFQTCMAALR